MPNDTVKSRSIPPEGATSNLDFPPLELIAGGLRVQERVVLLPPRPLQKEMFDPVRDLPAYLPGGVKLEFTPNANDTHRSSDDDFESKTMRKMQFPKSEITRTRPIGSNFAFRRT